MDFKNFIQIQFNCLIENGKCLHKDEKKKTGERDIYLILVIKNRISLINSYSILKLKIFLV